MTPEKREEQKMRIIKELRGKVRPHRPAEKVIEIAIAMGEDQVEREEERIDNLRWGLNYLRELKPSEIKPEAKS